MHLLTHIYSYINPLHCYGNEGDKVNMIAVHSDVAIVEGENGQRFPVPVKCLSEYANNNEPATDTNRVASQQNSELRKQKRSRLSAGSKGDSAPSLFSD